MSDSVTPDPSPTGIPLTAKPWSETELGFLRRHVERTGDPASGRALATIDANKAEYEAQWDRVVGGLNARIDALTEKLTLAEGALRPFTDCECENDGPECPLVFGMPRELWCKSCNARSYFSPPTTEGTTNDE